MLGDSSLVQCTCTIIIIHTVRLCKWKAIMMIYDGLIEMREAGMNSTSLVFVNMISSLFLIQPIMNETCLQWQLEIIVAQLLSYSCLHSMFINFNACSWPLSVSSWSLPSLFLAFTCSKREYCLCIHFHKPQSYSIWFHHTFLYAVLPYRPK